jgi:hypothetical protein
MGPSLPAAALALLSLFAVGSCREAQFDAENFNTSDATRYYGGWVSARATWYGQPNGAGPDDNGERLGTSCIFFQDPFPSPLRRHLCFVDLGNAAHLLLPDPLNLRYCRWCLRVQAHQPVPVHVHGLLRQPAHLQGRQGLRILLQGKNQRSFLLLFSCKSRTDPASV